MLVKGNLQGSVKNPKKPTPNKLAINKKSFLDSFKTILKLIKPESDELDYSEAKKLSDKFNKASGQFFTIYKDWIKTDPEKYYKFN